MILNDYQTYFNQSYDQFILQNNISRSQIHENVKYEKITAVSRIDVGDNQFFFFKDDKLRVIYISDEVLANEIWNEFKSTAQPDKTVRSRAGKTSNQLIFAGKGITVSTKGNDVDFIEIYRPCTAQDYLDNIYHEPQAFIR
jgi:hypothetical protein